MVIPSFGEDHIWVILTGWKNLTYLSLENTKFSGKLVRMLATATQGLSKLEQIKIESNGPLRLMNSISNFLSLFASSLKIVHLINVSLEMMPTLPLLQTLRYQDISNNALEVDTIMRRYPFLDRLVISDSRVSKLIQDRYLAKYNTSRERLVFDTTMP